MAFEEYTYEKQAEKGKPDKLGYQRDNGYSVSSQEDVLGQEMQITRQGPQEKNGYASLLRNAQYLRETKKSGENSDRFNAVDGALSNLFRHMQMGFSGKEDVHKARVIAQVLNAYEYLIRMCQVYVQGKFRFTSVGKERRQIVREILHQAIVDQAGLRNYIDMDMALPIQERADSVLEALEIARRRTLELSGKTENDLRHVGGAASYIAVIEKGDLKDQEASGYFKEEDIFTHTDGRTIVLNILETIQKRKKLNETDYQSIRKIVEETENSEEGDGQAMLALWNAVKKKLDKYWEDEDYHEFVDAVTKACGGQKEIMGKIFTAEVKMDLAKGERVNMSKRNVAASRIANLFGVGELIAQSETAVLKDSTGKSVTGNLMQAAKGREGRTVLMDLQREKFKKTRKENNYTGSTMDSLEDEYFTPEFLKSLTSLQVLDGLMGQVDRHNANYMIQQDEKGRMGKVQGIDNDFAFGHYGQFGYGGHERTVFDTDRVDGRNYEQANLAIPYMDEALANRILKVQPEEVRMVLADVLEEKAIEAFCQRLLMVQYAIEKDRKENPDSTRYIKNLEDWAKTLNTFRKDSKLGGADAKTYVGTLMAQTHEIGNRAYTYTNLIMEETVEMVKEFLREELQKPEYRGLNEEEFAKKEKEFLAKSVNNKNLLNYLEKTGRLNGNEDIVEEYYEEIAKQLYGKAISKYRN